MPANYQSRLPSANADKIAEITECFDPFQPDLCALQKADKSLQHMNFSCVNGQWPDGLPKSEANYLKNLAIKLFQDANNILWIRLDNYKYPRTALFLPEKYRKLALCEAHNHQFGGHNSVLKTDICISSSYYWPKLWKDILNQTKSCLRCQQRKKQRINLHYCNLFQPQTNPPSGYTQIFSAQCSQPNVSTNTFCASQMPLPNMHWSQPWKKKKRRQWQKPFFQNGFVNSASQCKFTQMVGKSLPTSYRANC